LRPKNRPEHSPELQIIVRQPSPISVGFEPVVKVNTIQKVPQKQRLPHEETGNKLDQVASSNEEYGDQPTGFSAQTFMQFSLALVRTTTSVSVQGLWMEVCTEPIFMDRIAAGTSNPYFASWSKMRNSGAS
jgi:hypothetical protein